MGKMFKLVLEVVFGNVNQICIPSDSVVGLCVRNVASFDSDTR
jgi:hypothetical protein